MARPKVAEELCFMNIYVTPEQKDVLCMTARSAKVSPSQFIRNWIDKDIRKVPRTTGADLFKETSNGR